MGMFCLTGQIVFPRVSLQPYFCSLKKWNQSSLEMTLPLSYLHILLLHVATQRAILISLLLAKTPKHDSLCKWYVLGNNQRSLLKSNWKQ